MTYGIGPINSQQSYLPPEQDFPEDEDLFREILSQRERLTATILNVKENGQYETQELLTGQQFFNTATSQQSRQPRYTYRIVVNFGALPNNTTKSVAHNIQNIDPGAGASTFSVTRIYGASTNPTHGSVKWIPLPYVSATEANEIELWADATNVNITTTANYSAYTVTYVILEYIKAT